MPQGVATYASNHVWVSEVFGVNGTGTGSLLEYSNTGTLLSPAAGFSNAGILYPEDLAIDGSGNVYSSQSQLGEITNLGVAVSPSTGYQNPDPNDCCLVTAIEGAGSLWLTGGSYLY